MKIIFTRTDKGSLYSGGRIQDAHLDLVDGLAQAKHQMQRALLLDVVVVERHIVFELLAGEDEPLLFRCDALFRFDLLLDDLDALGRLHLQRDRLAGERLDVDLHPLLPPSAVYDAGRSNWPAKGRTW